MTPETEQLRIKVAELAGWFDIKIEDGYDDYLGPIEVLVGHDPSSDLIRQTVPELTLDWLHKLVQGFTEHQRQAWSYKLCVIVGKHNLFDTANATAEQRARAYIAAMEQANPKQED